MNKAIPVLGGVMLCMAVWACHGAGQQSERAPPHPAKVQVASDLPDYAFVPLRRLPRSPEKTALDDYCSPYRLEKQSALARSVEQQGWIVTSEAPLGRYRVVTFASGFDPGTSMLCFARNANLAVFDGANLVALAYAKRPGRGPDADGNPVPLGKAEPLEDGTGLLIWTDPPGVPIGELQLAGNRLRLVARAAQHAYCGGRTSLPDLYGKSIEDARRLLLARGWQPQPPAEAPDALPGHPPLAELESCSGTGVGYCAWAYRNKAALLHVTTVGEDYTVSSYGVECVPG